MPVTVMLDAGHGGVNPGAVYEGRQEKDDALALVLAIGPILQNNGIDVLYTRTTDVYQTPLQKAELANEADVDYFVSIHRNSFPEDNVVSGVESLVYDLSGVKYEMAQNINAQLETVGFVDLGVKARPNLIVLRRTKMPAVLVEAGFINSNTDNMLFDANFQAIAQAIADGIIETIAVQPETLESRYSVQVGAFRNRNYAEDLQEELMEMDFPARIERGDGYFRVRVGDFRTIDEASRLERRLKRAGYQTVIVT
ncbi:MAG: N-acetylmuramoyl-L-alanine amidase [Tyzzerella sp.]|nr:N-acetylmuramoyl-L-alanine amidase [Tyzzerella sp.]